MSTPTSVHTERRALLRLSLWLMVGGTVLGTCNLLYPHPMTSVFSVTLLSFACIGLSLALQTLPLTSKSSTSPSDRPTPTPSTSSILMEPSDPRSEWLRDMAPPMPTYLPGHKLPRTSSSSRRIFFRPPLTFRAFSTFPTEGWRLSEIK